MRYNIDDYLLNELPSISITPPFCDCIFPRNIDVINNKNVHKLNNCKCVENGHLNGSKDWIWDKESGHSNSYINNDEVTFHPIYSKGTAFVRGEKKLELNMIHYWEIQIITKPAGTDEMFGIGTDQLNFNDYRFKFVSGLGRDNQSWGFSYHGLKTHDGIAIGYGKRITQGCVVGVYLDLFHGCLEFFLNRKPLGLAYKNIPLETGVNIYPMVSATSSRCSIKLLNSTSQPFSLQFQTMRAIIKESQLLKEIEAYAGLKPLLNKFWFLISSTRYSHRSKRNELPLEDEVVLSKRAKKLKFNTNDQGLDSNDIYENIGNISILKSEDEDDSIDGMFLLL